MSDEQQHSEHLSDRLKEVPGFIKEQFGTVEQEPPNRPSFLFVVLLAGAVVIAIFIVALLILHSGGAGLTRHSLRKHPTSQMVMPASSASAVRWSA
jgi:hypothetical protein